MKLLLENWRKYLEESKEEELQKALADLIQKYNLDKEDVEKLTEETLKEGLGDDLKALYKQFGKRAVTAGLAGMLTMGAIAPQSAEAGILDTGRAIATVVSNPSVVQDINKMINLIKLYGNEREALAHLDSVIETLGGPAAAKALIDDAIDSEMLVSLALRTAKAEYEKTLEDDIERISTPPLRSEKAGIAPLLAQYNVIDQNDHSTEGLKRVISHRLGQDSADKIEQFSLKITDGMGWGATAEEIEAYKNNLAQQISKIDGRPVDQIGYL